MSEASALTDLLVRAGIELARDTREHAQTCECRDCADLTALWMGTDDEAHAKITAEIWDSFPVGAVSDQESQDEGEGIDLMALAINTVIQSYDSPDYQDLSDQIVALILSEEIFQPLRERIYESLFDA